MNKHIKNLSNLEQELLTHKGSTKPERFFKTDPGSYAQHEQFLGITNPVLRTFSKIYAHLDISDIKKLLLSPFNEKRLLALFILIKQYQKGDQQTKNNVFAFYLDTINQVNNWNLVDSSAHLIIGAHLQNQSKELLSKLATSKNLWHRRIAIVSTWYFIKQNDCTWTYKLAEQLLNDNQDLIHKAVGWMLREAAKKDDRQLITFLKQHAHNMPRTMLRYAIEKFDTEQRTYFLSLK